MCVINISYIFSILLFSDKSDLSFEVFISYNWDYQVLVTALRDALKENGYKCWMDIDFMKGGERLYEEIELGLRSSKVMVACVTEKYLKSGNCQLEFGYAHELEKIGNIQIIPLLIENIKPPFKGPTGLLISGKGNLYIKFSDLNNQKTQWKGHPQFGNLLHQIDKYTKQHEDEIVREHSGTVQAAASMPAIVKSMESLSLVAPGNNAA